MWINYHQLNWKFEVEVDTKFMRSLTVGLSSLFFYSISLILVRMKMQFIHFGSQHFKKNLFI